jgi:hypothetical protein
MTFLNPASDHHPRASAKPAAGFARPPSAPCVSPPAAGRTSAAHQPFLNFVRYLKGDREAIGDASYLLARHRAIIASTMTWPRSPSFRRFATSPARRSPRTPACRSTIRCFRCMTPATIGSSAGSNRATCSASWPGLSGSPRASARGAPSRPSTSSLHCEVVKTWMPATSAGMTAERIARDALLVGLFDDVGDLVGLGVDNDDRAVGHKKPVRAQRRDLLR